MKCQHCHNLVPETDRFCLYCGKPLATESLQPVALVCRVCGGELEKGDAFCPDCGAAVKEMPSGESPTIRIPQEMADALRPDRGSQPVVPIQQPIAEPNPRPAKKKKKRVILTVVLIMALLLALAAGGVTAWKLLGEEEPSGRSERREEAREEASDKDDRRSEREDEEPFAADEPTQEEPEEIPAVSAEDPETEAPEAEAPVEVPPVEDSGVVLTQVLLDDAQMRVELDDTAGEQVLVTIQLKRQLTAGEDTAALISAALKEYVPAYEQQTLDVMLYARDSSGEAVLVCSDWVYFDDGWQSGGALLAALAEEEEPTESEQEEPSSYLLPESNSRLLTDADLEALTHEELCFARNEIYARHGYIFKVPEVAAYFDQQDWYEGTTTGEAFNIGVLNSCELANIQFISDYEAVHWGGSYY